MIGRVLVVTLVLAGCDDDSGTSASDAARPGTDASLPRSDMATAPCTPSTEVCNGTDDDCDGLVDTDPELLRTLHDDPESCGRCGRVCAADNAELECRAGNCFIVACTPGYNDQNGSALDGCETDCLVTAGGREVCDGLDNDCDDLVDEGFDLSSDVAHCGACDAACPDAERGHVACLDGACAVDGCDAGFHDLDGELANGCEYACTATATERVREACNGVDDDCDGAVDEAADLVVPDDFCGDRGVCARGCDDDVACMGAERCNDGVCVPRDPPEVACDGDADCHAVHPGLGCVGGACVARTHAPMCDGGAGYRCVRAPAFRSGNEAGACDEVDNDCDGRVDEDYVDDLFTDGAARARPRTCEAGIGGCRRVATFACAPDADGVECRAFAAEPDGPDDDDCDARDDDCDGEVDEDHVPAWVELDGYAIFAYEASRPGASAEAEGVDPTPDDALEAFVESRACSVAGVLPWANATLDQAEAACASAGARLCSGAQWEAACDGGVGRAYPYGAVYDPDACNGGEHDVDPDAPGLQDAALATGSLPRCEAGGVFDLSGNLKEWTRDVVDGLNRVRGGGYGSNVPAGLACQQRDDLRRPEVRGRNLGFRCCRAL